MPFVTIHDLTEIDGTTLSDDAELVVNNSDTESLEANKVKLSTLLSGVFTQINNLIKIQKISQVDYEALTTKDENTLYAVALTDDSGVKLYLGSDEIVM